MFLVCVVFLQEVGIRVLHNFLAFTAPKFRCHYLIFLINRLFSNNFFLGRPLYFFVYLVLNVLCQILKIYFLITRSRIFNCHCFIVRTNVYFVLLNWKRTRYLDAPSIIFSASSFRKKTHFSCPNSFLHLLGKCIALVAYCCIDFDINS